MSRMTYEELTELRSVSKAYVRALRRAAEIESQRMEHRLMLEEWEAKVVAERQAAALRRNPLKYGTYK